MSRVDARVQVIDTEGGRTFTQRFDTTPIRIGRALCSDLVLAHTAIAGRHGEISIGPRFAYFRTRAWLRRSWIDGIRVKRGRGVKLTQDSVITIGPFQVKLSFRVRDRRYERERKVTPLVLAVVPGSQQRPSPATDETPRLLDPRPLPALPEARGGSVPVAARAVTRAAFGSRAGH